MRPGKLTRTILILFVSLFWAITSCHGSDQPPPADGSPGAVHADDAHSAEHAPQAGGHHAGNLGETLPLWSCIPFAGMLLSQSMQAVGISAMSYTFWVWVHAVASFIFIAFIPFSKAWQIFVSPIEIVLDASERS